MFLCTCTRSSGLTTVLDSYRNSFILPRFSSLFFFLSGFLMSILKGTYVTGTEFGLRKRLRGSDASTVFGDSGIDASRYTDEWQCFWCTCTVVFLLEDQSWWLWCHEMTSQGSLVLSREGTIKGEHTQTSGLSSGSSDAEHLGLLTSHRPSTLAISVPLLEQSITRLNCVICLSICIYTDLSGELLVSVTLVVWH